MPYLLSLNSTLRWCPFGALRQIAHHRPYTAREYHRSMRCALVSLLLAGVAFPQDLLPPGVLLLSRVKRHTAEELSRLPNISCLETVQREYQPPNGKMRTLDTVRLE